MQRGMPTSLQIKNQPQAHTVYDMICKEFKHTKEERIRLMSMVSAGVFHYDKDKQKALDEINKLKIEYDLLGKIKTYIENPKYYDEVCDGNS